MNPYRDSARPFPVKPICERPWWLGGGHKVIVVRTLKGGDGPDDAAAEIACSRCSATGWRYCDGSESLSMRWAVVDNGG
jgi:hypothetical protein